MSAGGFGGKGCTKCAPNPCTPRPGVRMCFFFQAEDGIRDYKVTGVQTCALPILDHWWLDWLEASVPAAQTLFLSADEHDTRREAVEDVRRSVAELERVRAMQREAQWGTRPATEEMQVRMRQYLAGRAEILAGDRLGLRQPQARARGPPGRVPGGPPVEVRP